MQAWSRLEVVWHARALCPPCTTHHPHGVRGSATGLHRHGRCGCTGQTISHKCLGGKGVALVLSRHDRSSRPPATPPSKQARSRPLSHRQHWTAYTAALRVESVKVSPALTDFTRQLKCRVRCVTCLLPGCFALECKARLASLRSGEVWRTCSWAKGLQVRCQLAVSMHETDFQLCLRERLRLFNCCLS
jgi:hypothetical protein